MYYRFVYAVLYEYNFYFVGEFIDWKMEVGSWIYEWINKYIIIFIENNLKSVAKGPLNENWKEKKW